MPDIDDIIQKAQQEGKFDHLPGKGKPLRLDGDPFVEPEWRLAHHMLKSSGFTLPWIEKRKEILLALETARAELTRTWAWYEENPDQADAQITWQRALNLFSDRVERLNKQIIAINLEVPSIQFHLPAIQYEKEVEAICS